VRCTITELPAWPFGVACLPDGAGAVLTLPRAGARGLIGLRAGSPWSVARVVWTADAVAPRGLAIERTGRHAVVANSCGGLLIVACARLFADEDTDPILVSVPSPGIESMQVVLTPDERHAIVADEASATLSVFALDGSLSSSDPGAELVGQVRVPAGPVGLACTPDGRDLVVVCQVDGRCGRICVLRLEDVVRDPARAEHVSAAAGASPVRVAVSGDGALAWVTLRGANTLVAFDLAGVRAGARRTVRAAVRVGAAPVGLAVLDGGSLVVVANSNRYGADAMSPQSLSVVDASAALSGRAPVLGTITAGAFPRELAALPDDRGVLVTNVLSQSLQSAQF
jgi:DNA-binding beta-propeller fold protein YncE